MANQNRYNTGRYSLPVLNDYGRWPICWDVAKLVKARGFDPRIRRFESCRPSHFFFQLQTSQVQP